MNCTKAVYFGKGKGIIFMNVCIVICCCKIEKCVACTTFLQRLVVQYFLNLAILVIEIRLIVQPLRAYLLCERKTDYNYRGIGMNFMNGEKISEQLTFSAPFPRQYF